MRIFAVDSFTDKPFSGNPAGVCIQDKDYPELLYQRIAREMNYSETAFVRLKNGVVHIRWFTPKTEVDLCGHATLAAAFLLYEYQYFGLSEEIKFISRKETLIARKCSEKIEIDFPQVFVEKVVDNETLERAFDIKPVFVGKNSNRYLIEIGDCQKLYSLKPDFNQLNSLDLGRFILTVKSDNPKYDFISRYFAPGVGVPEYPVTGTSHCYLAPYWGKKLNKTHLVGFQASERSGIVECELKNSRVFLRGKAVLMYEIIPKWSILSSDF